MPEIVEDYKLEYQHEREVNKFINSYQNKTFDAPKFFGSIKDCVQVPFITKKNRVLYR